MQLRTKTGRLTAYALQCGYLEFKQAGDLVTELFAREGAYHVRQIDNATGARMFWLAYPTAAEARCLFNTLPGRLVNRGEKQK